MSDDDIYEDSTDDVRLTDRQLRLIDEYMVDLNKTQAYIRAGYKVPENRDRLGVVVARTFKSASVRREIDRRLSENRMKSEKRSPLDVMLANMEHWYKIATDGGTDKGLAAQARAMAQNCAREAAPYMHPRMASVTFTGTLDVRNMTDEQLAAFVQTGQQVVADAGVTADSATGDGPPRVH